jgi:flagellar basal body-associated protein FliL
MASQVITPKKSHKKLYTIIAIIVLLIVVAGAGLFAYKVAVLDPQAAKDAAAAAASPSPAAQTPEQKMTASLKDGLKKQEEALKQSDDTTYIKNASAAAANAGSGLNEQDLHE